MKHPETLPREFRELSIGNVQARWYHLPEITSTMDIAAVHAHEGGAPWTVISADVQTMGRGTHGRDWYSPAEQGFWVSVLLPLPERIEYVDGYTLHAAGALADTVGALTGLVCTIKHPNDVMVEGRKLAGILIESVSAGDKPVSLILGMGVNLCQSAKDFQDADLPEATSLLMETGVTVDPEELLRSCLTLFQERIFEPVPEHTRTGIVHGGSQCCS